jgi:hypothetical protein
MARRIRLMSRARFQPGIRAKSRNEVFLKQRLSRVESMQEKKGLIFDTAIEPQS